MVDDQPKSMVRIAVFPGFFYPHLGGHEKYVEEVYSRMVTAGFSVDIIVPNTEHTTDYEVYRGMGVYRYDCWNVLGGTYPIPKINIRLWRLLRRLRHHQYTIVNTQTRFFTNAFLGTIFSVFTHTRHFHTEHGTGHVRLHSWITTMLAWLYDHSIGSLIMHHAKMIIAISEASGQYARHLGAKEFTIVPNGVDVETFIPAPVAIPHEALRVTFIGRLIRSKGVQDLLKIWSAPSFSAIELHIVGDGPYRATLQATAKELRMVFFHGSLLQPQIIARLQQTDIFVNPSYGEGLPTSVLEAASCSCAIIATKVGGTAEIFSPDHQHWLFQPGDLSTLQTRLQELIEDAPLRRQLGLENREMVLRKYSWPNIVERYIQFMTAQRSTIPHRLSA